MVLYKNHNTSEPQDEYEVAELLQAIEGVTEIEPYCLINNYGCYFTKNKKRFDIRRWLNCYGVDAGWSVQGTKDNTLDACIQAIKEA